MVDNHTCGLENMYRPARSLYKGECYTFLLFNEYLRFSNWRIWESKKVFFIVEMLRIYDEKKEIDQL